MLLLLLQPLLDEVVVVSLGELLILQVVEVNTLSGVDEEETMLQYLLSLCCLLIYLTQKSKPQSCGKENEVKKLTPRTRSHSSLEAPLN